LTKLKTITSNLCRRFETCRMPYLALVGIAHQLRSIWYYGFITIFVKTNSPSTLNRNGRFLSQNYITPYNNLVNMIVLLGYFPIGISVCLWNKLYASFYLKHVMIMSPFKILNEVWFVKYGHCSSLGASRDKLSLVLVIRIMFVLNSRL
jgi:hypothetical protein